MKICLCTGICFILLQGGVMHAQDYTYSGSTPLEKSFLTEDLFGHPQTVGPNYLGPFEEWAEGIINDPLLNLALNPALLPDQNHYVYADYSTYQKRTIEQIEHYYVYSARYRTLNFINDVSGLQKETAPQPRVSLVYLSRPFTNRHIFVGAAYQSMLYNDKYYFLDDAYDIEYNVNTLDQQAQFITFWGGYQFHSMSLGFKINRTIYNRTGLFKGRPQYVYAIPAYDILPYPLLSNYTLSQTQSQDYRHWDTSIGVAGTVRPRLTVGISLGFITSGSSQKQSELSNNYIPVTSIPNYNNTSSSTPKSWNHDGKTWYGSAFFRYKLAEHTQFNMIYRGTFLDNNLHLNGETNQNTQYKSTYTYRDTVYTDLQATSVNDTRRGGGTQRDNDHLVSGMFNFNISSKISLMGGLGIEVENIKLNTTEPVNYQSMYYDSRQRQPGLQADTTTRSVQEEKKLSWNSHDRTRSFILPVIYNQWIQEWLGIQLAVSFRFNHLSHKETITQEIKNRQVTTNDDILPTDGSLLVDTEHYSDDYFELPCLAGVMLRPAPKINLRLSTHPVFFRHLAEYRSVTNWRGFLSIALSL